MNTPVESREKNLASSLYLVLAEDYLKLEAINVVNISGLLILAHQLQLSR